MKTLIFLLLFIGNAFAQNPDLCDLLDLKNCTSVTKQGRRASSVSLPSPSTSAMFNPATVSFDRGLGVEAITQAGNPTVFGLASGTGKFGGALISSSLENSFFGNRIYELDDQYLKRHKNKKQFKTKKLSLALGLKLMRKKNLNLDFGIIAKRHKEIGDWNPGAGLSGRVRFLTFGFSVYRDDFYLNFKDHVNPYTGATYEQHYGMEDYDEKFTVNTFSFGTKIGDLALDLGYITTKYELDQDKSTVKLYSASYVYRYMRANFAIRNENNSTPKYKDDQLLFERSKTYYYGGLQFSLGKHLIAGVNYNYFLLNELSLITTFFF